MRDLTAREAIRRIRDRTIAASGLTVEELRQGAQVDADPDVVLRRLLADVMRPEDLHELLDEGGLLMEIVTEFLAAFVPELLQSCMVLGPDGEQLEARIVFHLSPATGGMAYTAVGQHVAVGLLMRREGEDG